MAVVDGHFDKRVRLTSPEVVSLAKRILEQISGFVSKEYLINLEVPEGQIDELLLMMQDFRKNCKKRKQILVTEDLGSYPNSCSLDGDSSQRESSESNYSTKKQNSEKRKRSLDNCAEILPMDL